jgi:SnoaL-like protein
MAEPTVVKRLEHAVRAYIDACNDGDATVIAACFCPEAVHYIPSSPKWSGAGTIGNNFTKMVRELGYRWTVDQLLVDDDRCAVALEWSSYRNPEHTRIVRGVDWIVFDPQTLRIREIRPYIASPPHPDLARHEQKDFDYVGRGYPA